MALWVIAGAAAWVLTIWITVSFVGVRKFGLPTTRGSWDGAPLDAGEFIRYPTDQLFAIVDDSGETGRAIPALRAAGIEEDGISSFRGEAGAVRIDASGSHHGLFARLVRVSQAMSMDGDQSQRYEDEARSGHTVIAASAPATEVPDRALGILKAHGGHYINYYARLHSENLEP